MSIFFLASVSVQLELDKSYPMPCSLCAYWKGKGSVDFSRHLPTIPTFKSRNGQTPIMLSCTWSNYYFIFPLIQLLTWGTGHFLPISYLKKRESQWSKFNLVFGICLVEFLLPEISYILKLFLFQSKRWRIS